MDKVARLSLYIFRRDLRLEDNTALIEALKQSDQVIPCFIFDTRQIGNNAYKSQNSLAFMANSLHELDLALQSKQKQLYCFHGIAETIVEALVTKLPITAVFHNRDYTPFSRQRDSAIKKVCEAHNIHYQCYADALLHEPEEGLKANGRPYTIFTPAFKKASSLPISPPKKNNGVNYYHQPIPGADRSLLDKLCLNQNKHLFVNGGRAEALALLKNLTELTNYKADRDIPEKSATSKLSAHLKFGTLSVRECYAAICKTLNPHHPLITQLHWRDFFTHIAYHFPHVFEGAFHQKFNRLAWSYDENAFQAWCQGQTGFPIVDAGMRELNTTGYMHNRVRMITASFLTKDLHMDWRLGEKYFATQLVDYDPALNNGNWQWAASTGCDAQPYFRIFNPWLQQAKFDPGAIYIKRWVPELAGLSSKAIHALQNNPHPGYPSPIVSHAIESQKAKLMYKHL